jgi:excinuclease ABC subunit C
MPRKKQAKAKKKTDPLKQLRTRVARASQKPGVYRWLDKSGNILYIGKAKNLRNRLKTYTQKDPDKSLGPWKLSLIKKITDVDVTITSTEIEALILETNLIKEHKPKYNVLMKDDKNYVYLRITINDAYPNVQIVRQMENDKAKYFGPFLSARDTRRTLELLHELFPFQACKRSIDMLNKDPDAECKPCIEEQIGRCCGLCKGKLSKEEYRGRIDEVIRFFKGTRDHVKDKLQEFMQEAVATKKFERAAKLRDTLNYIKTLEEQQIVSDTSGANTDAIGVALQKDRAQVVVIQERGGKVINELSFSLAGQADTTEEILEQFLPQYYSDITEYPDIILISEDIDDQEVLEKWINESRVNESRVNVRAPERGKKSKLIIMAEENAKEKVKQQLAKWESAVQQVDDSLTELKELLDLEDKPKRIECYDISHHGGTETVGSMVVFINGKANNKDYRSFTIRTMKDGEIDDYKALKEVLTRRLRHLKKDKKSECDNENIALEKSNKAYIITDQTLEGIYLERGFITVRKIPKELTKKVTKGEIVMLFDHKKHKLDKSLTSTPDLLVLDGGKGQLSTGTEVLKATQLDIPIISIAKREEEIYAPGNNLPLPLKKDSEARFLIMRMRDEAHRFANWHREKRAKKGLTS